MLDAVAIWVTTMIIPLGSYFPIQLTALRLKTHTVHELVVPETVE
jgi:hypothetical protein